MLTDRQTDRQTDKQTRAKTFTSSFVRGKQRVRIEIRRTVCCLAGLAPQLLEGLTNVRVKAPEKVELICRITPGNPTAEIEWYRSGDCDKINKYNTATDGDVMSLTIAVSESSDSAIYRCEAVNKFGEVRTECRVDVLGTLLILRCVNNLCFAFVYCIVCLSWLPALFKIKFIILLAAAVILKY